MLWLKSYFIIPAMEQREKKTDFEEMLNRNTIPGEITRQFLEETHPENLPVLITDFVIEKISKKTTSETVKILKSLPLGTRTIYLLVRFEDCVNQNGFYGTFKGFLESDPYLSGELFSALKIIKARDSFKITRKAFLVLYGFKGLICLANGKKLPDCPARMERKKRKLRKSEEEFFLKSTDLGICEVDFIMKNKDLFTSSAENPEILKNRKPPLWGI